MSTLSLPHISTLSSLPDQAITNALDLLFEPSKELHALSLPAIRAAPSIASYDDLIEIVRGELLTLQGKVATFAEPSPSHEALACKQRLLGILAAHPRLGAKKVESAQSAAEQAQLQKASELEAAQLAALNAEYESSFPGLIYIVFVNGRPREVIMENMRARIKRGVYALEEIEAIEAMASIAKDRASKLPQGNA
ncbi:hypothetical protein SEUCBS140593_010315 [Sporothrix eucalyptigena]|uniref:Oxo-4-hydroxy-4-carboxy-5-ureidoimidazoline decarboxylase domain-containing protein n=1 Tax=Sporothrix eucalyptigena TaxID=1812306 RepID=A0ABP0D156_9PEZI